MEFTPFCCYLQKCILSIRVGIDAHLDMEEILVSCLRTIVELEEKVRNLENNPPKTNREVLQKRTIRS